MASIEKGAALDSYQNGFLPEFHLMYQGNVYNDQEQVVEIYQDLIAMIGDSGNCQLLHKTVTASGNVMSISVITTVNRSYAILSAFRNLKGAFSKEFEFIIPIEDSNKADHKSINKMRELWVNHSNNNRPDLVVNEVYSANAFYLNRGKLLNDRPLIIEEYKYMLNPGWSIELVEQGFLQVNENISIEIGTYANYRGQYLLIWSRQSDESWKIALDFNF